jgi:2-polyprenyl-6-methoxyphenol hydroxylase-like FAD-dependent oxidoreductase
VRSLFHCHIHHHAPPVFLITPLPRRHLRVALVDSSWPTTLDAQGQVCRQAEQQCAEPASGRDRRVYAISPASRQLLQAVGAWQLLPADGVHNYDAMQVCFPLNAAARDCDGPQVWQALGAGVLQLKAGDVGLESLGSIVGHSALQAALKQRVLDTDVVCIGSQARSISSLPPAAAAAAGHVLTAGGFSVSCSLLVGADGAASPVRAHSGIGDAHHQRLHFSPAH